MLFLLPPLPYSSAVTEESRPNTDQDKQKSPQERACDAEEKGRSIAGT